MAFTFPKLTIPTGRTPQSIMSPTAIRTRAAMTKVKSQVSIMPRFKKPLTPGQALTQSYTRRPPPRIQMPRFQPPKPGAIQDFINKWTGATPDQPIQLPFQYGEVKVKADRTTRNLLLGVGGLIVVAILWPKG